MMRNTCKRYIALLMVCAILLTGFPVTPAAATETISTGDAILTATGAAETKAAAETTAPTVTTEATEDTETQPQENGCTCAAENERHSAECSLYVPTLLEKLMLTQTLAECHALMESDTASVRAMTAEELASLKAHAQTLYTALEEPTQDDEDYYVLITETVEYLLAERTPEEPAILDLNDRVIIGDATYEVTDVESLVEADLALLRWEAMGSEDDSPVSGMFANTEYTGFAAVYEQVYSQLLEKATTVYGNENNRIPSATSSVATYTSGIRIFKIKAGAKVYLDNYIEVYNTAKVIIVAEADATIELGSENGGRFTMGYPGGVGKQDNCCFAIQGSSGSANITIQGDGQIHEGTPAFRLCGGSLYLYNVVLQNLMFGDSEIGDAVIYAPTGYNTKKNLYMANSTMRNISAGKSPGIFLRSYTTSEEGNAENQKSWLYLYNNTFTECKNRGNLNYAGGPVIRSFAADNCNLRVEKCKFIGNSNNSYNTASGGGAIYWKSAAGIAHLIDCEFVDNYSRSIGGAIFNTGQMTIKNCRFTENEAVQGGGAIAAEPPRTSSNFANIDTNNLTGSLTLDTQTKIWNNRTNGNGGAIYFNALRGDNGVNADPQVMIEEYRMKIDVEGAQIYDNSAAANGGAIAMWLNYGSYNYETGITIKAGSITGNKAGNNGGAIWMSSNDDCDCIGNIGVIMSGGTVAGNEAIGNGGAIYIETGKKEAEMNLAMSGGQLGSEELSNRATLGGGVYIKGGSAEVSGGQVVNNAADIGGGVYMSGGTMSMTGGSFTGNSATSDGGGAYLTGGDFTMNGESASFENNSAINGAGVYLTGGTPNLKQGSLTANTATNDGGGIFIDQQIVTLAPEGAMNITANTAKRGGGIFIGGTNGTDAAFTVDDTSLGTVNLSGNIAQTEGGAVCINNGYFELESDKITLESNKADNGGAVAVLGGNFTLGGNGSVGSEGKGNFANTGGAIYVQGGIATVSGGQIQYNIAQVNGGGIAVNNGNYRMTGGNVDHNEALNGDGGGIFVSAQGADVTVEVLSGSVSSNTSQNNGGALAVEGASDGTENITVQIGVPDKHFDEQGNRMECQHGAVTALTCPVMNDNRATVSGGGVYVTGNANTRLNVYCLEEHGSAADGDKQQSNFMRVDGGKVLISASGSTPTDDTQNTRHGNIFIENTIYVTGGQFDIWGDMQNPRIHGVMTVDITKEGDYFVDHRVVDDYYKLRYFENFKDPVTGHVTGQYKELEIPIQSITITDGKYTYNDKEVTIGSEIANDTYAFGNEVISGSIYSHPGYTIQGWHTDPSGSLNGEYVSAAPNPQTKGGIDGWYNVGETYPIVRDLTIYAIWEANGYILRFDPNVPSGDTYQGTMVEENHTFDVAFDLTPNGFLYPGHTFTGWKDDAGNLYADGQNVNNLTTEKGGVVTLHAQWGECDHDDTKHVYIYTLENEGKTIRRTCSCQGYSETVTLGAENTVYDRTEHPAEATYSARIGNTDWATAITYTQLQTATNAEGETVESWVAIEGTPKFAGTYTASITAPIVTEDSGSEQNTVTATVLYTIEKADQPAPPKPEFETSKDESGKWYLKVKHVAASPYGTEGNAEYDVNYKAVPEYKVVYYDSNGTEYTTNWKVADSDTTDEYAMVLETTVALTYYHVYARYGEDDNYKVSPETPADSVYYFEGDVVLKVHPGEGVLYTRAEMTTTPGGGTDEKISGILLKVYADAGYYIPKEYAPSSKTMHKDDQNDHTKQASFDTAKRETEESVYYVYCQLNQIPTECVIHVTLPDAKKLPTVAAAVEEGQIFGTVTGTAANISRDSAVTTYFAVEDYDGNTYDVPQLQFESELPAGTKLILMDKETNSYYYQVLSAEKATLALDSFTKMGTDTTRFALGEKMSLQLITDFTACGSYLDENVLVVTLALPCKMEESEGNVVQVQPQAQAASDEVTVTLSNVSAFTLEGEGTGRTQTVTHTYTASAGTASKWDHRKTALVLTPDNQSTLPSDAYIQATVNGYVTNIVANPTGSYVVPLSAPSTGTVTLKLCSELFPENETYKMTAKWYVSDSDAATSPMPTEVASCDISFSASAADEVSVKITADNRLYSAGTEVPAKITWKNLTANHELKVTLTRKSEQGNFASTGWEKTISRGDTQTTLTVPLSGQSSGSYCLEATVVHGLEKVAHAYFYFIIQ